MIYPETESVSVFGGEELNPPQFGKVFASIKPINGAYLSNLVKDNLKREIKKYSVGGVDLEITDLKFLYIESLVNVYYNSNDANEDLISSIVSDNIERYADSTELNKFGARFKYSKFLSVIDNSNSAITSNITTIQMRRDLRLLLIPLLNMKFVLETDSILSIMDMELTEVKLDTILNLQDSK